MYGVVQNPNRHQNSAISADMTRCPYTCTSRCVNLTAPHSSFCIISFMAGTLLRDGVDRIDAIMSMRNGTRLRVSHSNTQAKTACHGKTGVFCKSHIIRYPPADGHVVPKISSFKEIDNMGALPVTGPAHMGLACVLPKSAVTQPRD
jgi:hypothetical protein